MTNRLHISWNRIAILFLCACVFFPWQDDGLYSLGWVVVSVLISLRLLSGALSKVSIFAFVLLMIALLFGDWNHDALRYIGVILVLFIQPQNEDEAGGVANDFKFHLVCTTLFGVGIWMGVGFDGASSGLLELHCATWFVLIAFCMLNLKHHDPRKVYLLLFAFLFTCVFVTAWSSFAAGTVLLLWHFTRNFWTHRRLVTLSVVYASILVGMIFIAHKGISWFNENKENTPFAEGMMLESQSLDERLGLWEWTTSKFTGKVNGAGSWRQDIQGADLFIGNRQPRRAHNEWFHFSYELGWIGVVLLLLFCIVRPWSALIIAPIFLLWFPMERPDFILALAILHSASKSSLQGMWNPIKIPVAFIIPLCAFWILSWTMASRSVQVQNHISKHITTHHVLPELSTVDLWALQLFPENIRYGSDGWFRLGQYYLLNEDPCAALYWLNRREARGFRKGTNIDGKAKKECGNVKNSDP